MPDSPHLAYPIRITRSGGMVTEDGTLDDHASRAFFILRTPVGWRTEAPDFGVSDPTFSVGSTIPPTLASEIAASDPEVGVTVTDSPGALAEGISRIRVQIEQGA